MVEKICKKYGLVCGDVSYYVGDVPEKNIIEMESFVLMEEDLRKVPHGWYEYKKGWHYPSYEPVPNSKYGFIKRDWRIATFYETDLNKTFHFEKDEFKICASVKDFDTKSMRIEDGYKLNLNLPDPIVLQPVDGGYLIVTKWGLEGEDPSIVNEKMN